MHDGVRTDYNKELRAQGIGNLLCGVAGALPMTGVIVRSSANVQAGATSRLSTMLHGVWILGFVALLPSLLREIPMAALGAVLVITGVRLVSLAHVKHLFHSYGVLPALIWFVTLVTVVTQDLLTGVLIGIALSVLELVPHARRLGLNVDRANAANGTDMALSGSATFVTLPKLSDTLESLPLRGSDHGVVRMDVSGLTKVDHTCAELLKEFMSRRQAGGNPVELMGASPKLAAMMA
jgi:MFS superfamily sulfate permease-like transporter